MLGADADASWTKKICAEIFSVFTQKVWGLKIFWLFTEKFSEHILFLIELNPGSIFLTFQLFKPYLWRSVNTHTQKEICLKKGKYFSTLTEKYSDWNLNSFSKHFIIPTKLPPFTWVTINRYIYCKVALFPIQNDGP